MSYTSIAACAVDQAFMNRINACLVQEGEQFPVLANYFWQAAAQTDIEAAYESALASQNPNPGGDESVIPDQAILSFVQTFPPPPPTE